MTSRAICRQAGHQAAAELAQRPSRIGRDIEGGLARNAVERFGRFL